MLRKNKVDIYNNDVCIAFYELMNLYKDRMVESGDLLLCQQNGFLTTAGPAVGIGITGYNCSKQLNQLLFDGIGDVTEDDECFLKSRNIWFDGTADFERSVQKELNRYQNIWENKYYLRVLTQLAHLLNHEPYDWALDIEKETKRNTSNWLEHKIIDRFKDSTKFYDIISSAYQRQGRNAIAHSQYNFVQGGIILTNIESTKDSSFSGLTFEQWEEIYSKSWFLLLYIFQGLKQVIEEFYVPLCKETLSGGIPIAVPSKSGASILKPLFYFERGDRWSFNK